jgi:hypothetical protein
MTGDKIVKLSLEMANTHTILVGINAATGEWYAELLRKAFGYHTRQRTSYHEITSYYDETFIR